MEDAADNELVPPSSSSTPPLLVHCTITINEVCAHYMDKVQEGWDEKFQDVQADAAYNQHLLQENQQAEEELAAGRAIVTEGGLAQQAALLESYSLGCQICLNR
ncbi:Sulfotransferase [Hordeum vulgare]|nr:Sulfotransferase [Hordeum vulgare]